MTHKQIDACREARLWIGQLVIPAVSTVGAMLVIPEVRQAIAAKANDIKDRIQYSKK